MIDASVSFFSSSACPGACAGNGGVGGWGLGENKPVVRNQGCALLLASQLTLWVLAFLRSLSFSAVVGIANDKRALTSGILQPMKTTFFCGWGGAMHWAGVCPGHGGVFLHGVILGV